jgi:hypothetical protein
MERLKKHLVADRQKRLDDLSEQDNTFFDLTKTSAERFLNRVNAQLDQRCQVMEAILLSPTFSNDDNNQEYINCSLLLDKYESLIKLLQRDDLLDILEKCGTIEE